MKLEQVETVTDSERGCGWRKPGGLYLRFDGAMSACGKLPVPLDVCPCCHAGVKPARGWVWFNPQPFLAEKVCEYANTASKGMYCSKCPLEYNSAGQLLAPRSQWGEETGETASDYFQGLANPDRAFDDP